MLIPRRTTLPQRVPARWISNHLARFHPHKKHPPSTSPEKLILQIPELARSSRGRLQPRRAKTELQTPQGLGSTNRTSQTFAPDDVPERTSAFPIRLKM